jgi:predicted nucleic acid-binding protein
MTEPTKGLLDTSVVIDHDVIDAALLSDESAISAVTLAELAANSLPVYTRNPSGLWSVATSCGKRAARCLSRLLRLRSSRNRQQSAKTGD